MYKVDESLCIPFCDLIKIYKYFIGLFLGEWVCAHTLVYIKPFFEQPVRRSNDLVLRREDNNLGQLEKHVKARTVFIPDDYRIPNTWKIVLVSSLAPF